MTCARLLGSMLPRFNLTRERRESMPVFVLSGRTTSLEEKVTVISV